MSLTFINSIFNSQQYRLPEEEAFFKKGSISVQQTAWRESLDIPETAPTVFDSVTTQEIEGKTSKIHQKGVVAFCEMVPLTRYKKSPAFYSEIFQNVIPPEWDPSNQSYKIEFFKNSGEKITYSLGNPIIDSAAGAVRFDEDFLKTLDLSVKFPVWVSFYKYIGILGFYGSKDFERVPHPDDIDLIKSSEDFSKRAHFKLNQGKKSITYNLVENTVGYVQNLPNVLVLQENFEDIFHQSVAIDGGTWLPT